MGKKEERIRVEHFYDNKKSITRQEALEAIARAICKVDNGSKGCCVKDCLLWKLATSKAEAALNALLEGGK